MSDRNPNATPDALRKLANLILHGVQFQEVSVAEALRLCAGEWDQERAEFEMFRKNTAYREGLCLERIRRLERIAKRLYYRIDHPKDGDVVQFVGVHALEWGSAGMSTYPKVAFNEVDDAWLASALSESASAPDGSGEASQTEVPEGQESIPDV